MFTFNGTHANTYGLKVVDVDRSPLPDVENALLELSSLSGAYFVRNKVKPRTITVEVKVLGTSEADLRTKARSIANWLYTSQPADLVFDDETDKHYTAVVDTTSLTETLKVGEGTIKFTCPMPFAESVMQYGTLVAGSNTITTIGNYKTAPVLRLKAGATLTSIPIERYTSTSFTANFVNKVQASYAENPNVFKGAPAQTTVISPLAGGWVEHNTSWYTPIAELGGSSVTYTQTGAGYISQEQYTVNVVDVYERLYGRIPYATITEKVNFIKPLITNVLAKWYGYGTSPTGNKATFKRWNHTGATWDYTVNHTSGAVTMLQLSDSVANISTSTGNLLYGVHAEASDGTTGSSVITDYFEVVITFKKDLENITLTGSFANYDQIIINCGTGAVTLNNSNAMPTVNLESVYPILQAGANTLVLPTNVTGTIEYKNRWL